MVGDPAHQPSICNDKCNGDVPCIHSTPLLVPRCVVSTVCTYLHGKTLGQVGVHHDDGRSFSYSRL